MTSPMSLVEKQSGKYKRYPQSFRFQPNLKPEQTGLRVSMETPSFRGLTTSVQINKDSHQTKNLRSSFIFQLNPCMYTLLCDKLKKTVTKVFSETRSFLETSGLFSTFFATFHLLLPPQLRRINFIKRSRFVKLPVFRKS